MKYVFIVKHLTMTLHSNIRYDVTVNNKYTVDCNEHNMWEKICEDNLYEEYRINDRLTS